MRDYVAGVDEAGRGPLAGPVVAAAVILNPNAPIAGLADSKTLSAARREQVAAEIQARALAFAVQRVEHDEIDRLNILQASLLAMQRAVEALRPVPAQVLVDGRHVPALSVPAQAIVKGDATVAAISAASILAKVSRDGYMQVLDAEYPGYGFARHKGYPTRQHLSALQNKGACPVHRRSYAPVQRHL